MTPEQVVWRHLEFNELVAVGRALAADRCFHGDVELLCDQHPGEPVTLHVREGRPGDARMALYCPDLDCEAPMLTLAVVVDSRRIISPYSHEASREARAWFAALAGGAAP